MAKRHWIPVEGFEDKYLVCETGAVWSIKGQSFLAWHQRKTDGKIFYNFQYGFSKVRVFYEDLLEQYNKKVENRHGKN